MSHSEEDMNNEYSQGVCENGAAILKNGEPMSIEEILAELRSQESVGETLVKLGS